MMPIYAAKFAVVLTYPPASLTFIALKQERTLEVWAPGSNAPVMVAAYPILAANVTCFASAVKAWNRCWLSCGAA
ncbi:hypothetical protein MASR1M12_37540 [Erysipelotrichia bacterium]